MFNSARKYSTRVNEVNNEITRVEKSARSRKRRFAKFDGSDAKAGMAVQEIEFEMIGAASLRVETSFKEKRARALPFSSRKFIR